MQIARMPISSSLALASATGVLGARPRREAEARGRAAPGVIREVRSRRLSLCADGDGGRLIFPPRAKRSSLFTLLPLCLF